MTRFAMRTRAFCTGLLAGVAAVAAVALLLAAGLVHVAQIRAQAQAADASASIPRFEVSSIKPTGPDEVGSMLKLTPDGIVMTGVPVQMLLRQGFGVEDDRIIGVSGWVRSDRFDIQAKVDAEDAPKLKGLTIEQRAMMLPPLLEDRFKLKFHHLTRELPTYALVVAKSGPKLKEPKPEDTALNGGRGWHGMSMGRGKFEGKGAPIKFLIGPLSQQVGHTIVDKTGLIGNYDFTLKWTPDDAVPAMAGAGPGGPSVGGEAPAHEAVGPSLFTALEEQLGLKLESQKGPMDVIVIDHIEKPSEN